MTRWRLARRSRRDADEELDRIAATVHRLAVLLGAGVTPAAAWEYLGEPGAGVARARESGLPLPDAIRAALGHGARSGTWMAIATAWDVATRAGAPLASTLRELARALRVRAAIEREIETALAGPKATARIVLALPALGLLFGSALGFDSLRILATTPVGIACLATGIALIAVALAWIRSLVRTARTGEQNPGLRLDLMAIAVSGGASLDRAAATVRQALAASGMSGAGGAQEVDEVLDLAGRAGVPAAELLRSEARESRRRAAAMAERRAAILAVRLMLPLGACILPAFMVLGVIPLLVAVVSSTVVGF